MSDRFIATFLWLDKLGLGASLGMDVIIRQTIFDGNYGLIDKDYTPNPVRLLPVHKSKFNTFLHRTGGSVCCIKNL